MIAAAFIDIAGNESGNNRHIGEARGRKSGTNYNVAPALRTRLLRRDVEVLADVDGAAFRQIVGIKARRDDRAQRSAVAAAAREAKQMGGQSEAAARGPGAIRRPYLPGIHKRRIFL